MSTSSTAFNWFYQTVYMKLIYWTNYLNISNWYRDTKLLCFNYVIGLTFLIKRNEEETERKKTEEKKKENGTKVRLKDGRRNSTHDLKEEERRKEKIN